MSALAHTAYSRNDVGLQPEEGQARVPHRTVWAVTGVVVLLYGWWLFAYLWSGHDALNFVNFGRRYVHQGHASQVIKVNPRYIVNQSGYDGQFYYFIAVDPANARYYMDGPAYRYTRILYPMLARALTLGRVDLIPYTLILVNWFAVGLGTLAVAAWLARRRVSPWLALVFGLYPGLFISFQRDLTEPLSYALIACAIYCFDFGGKRRLLWSGLCFALAALARDKALIFAGLYSLALLFPLPARDSGWRAYRRYLEHRVRDAAVLGALAAGPALLYKVFLHFYFGSAGLPLNEEVAPLQGVVHSAGDRGHLILVLVVSIIPALITALMALWALWRRQWRVEVMVLLVMVELSVVSLNPVYFDDLYGILRVGIAVVLAALYCVPIFDRLGDRRRIWLWSAGALWLSLMPYWLGATSIWLLTSHR